MENNEIMSTEVMEVTEEIATTGPSKGVKIAAGIGLAAVISGLAYKFVVKPIVAKVKAKKEQQALELECTECDEEDINED